MENDCSLYYALIWNTTLEQKGDRFVIGEKITKTSKLPSDPTILYGTHNNDLKKIRSVEVWEEIVYDVATTKQSVRFHESVEEYELCRDVRIVVWNGSKELDLFNDEYKVVTPDLFEIMADYSSETGEMNEDIARWVKYQNPKKELNDECETAVSESRRITDTVITKYSNGKLTKLSIV